MIESVLYPSPYSGCQSFPGWPRNAPGPRIRSWEPRTLQTRLKANLSVDAYRPGHENRRGEFRREVCAPLPVTGGAARTQPPYNLHSIAGPSATGPWTLRTDGQGFAVGGIGASSAHSLGLT
jgi:hypothetical protein